MAQTNRGERAGQKKGFAGGKGPKYSSKTNNSSDYKDISSNSTRVLFNNLTGMTSGYKLGQPLGSQREDKTAMATTIFRGQQMVDHTEDRDLQEGEGDLYMSFIDSDKFSPIQSVSGEDIDEDDSLNH